MDSTTNNHHAEDLDHTGTAERTTNIALADRSPASAASCTHSLSDNQSEDPIADHAWSQGDCADYVDEQQDDDTDNESENDTWAEDNLSREALQHIATYFLPGNHGKCTSIAPFSSGGFHHIELLTFQDGWTCIGRFVYDKQQPLGMDEAEIATMQYVSRHTSILVPDIYFVNHNHNHVVGAAFVLMERVPGTVLWDLWEELSMSHKKSVLSQIADIATQLANLKFDQIGCLTTSGLGPLLQQDDSTHHGPFETLEDTFYGMINASSAASCCPECQDYCQCARREVKNFFAIPSPFQHLCDAPYSLQHADFTAGNMLFTQEDPDQAPVFTGLIDFDGSNTGPVYYQYNHSGLLITDDWREPESYASNKELRKHYVRTLAGHFPPGSRERADVHLSFRSESYFLERFLQLFPEFSKNHEEQQAQMKTFLTHCQNGTGESRSNVLKWAPDSDSELEDSVGDESMSDDVGDCDKRSDHGVDVEESYQM